MIALGPYLTCKAARHQSAYLLSAESATAVQPVSRPTRGIPRPTRQYRTLLYLSSARLTPSPAPARADDGVVRDDGPLWHGPRRTACRHRRCTKARHPRQQPLQEPSSMGTFATLTDTVAVRSLRGPPLRWPPAFLRSRARPRRGDGGIEGDQLADEKRTIKSVVVRTAPPVGVRPLTGT
jgi:hypothetical protein